MYVHPMLPLLRADSFVQEYVFSLRVRQLLAHPDMQAICAVLPNLTMVSRIDLTVADKIV